MIVTVAWQCMLIAYIICEVISKEESLNFPTADINSWSSTGTQEGCAGTICPKGVKRCLQQKLREKSMHERNMQTHKDTLISLNLQMPKSYSKPGRNLDVLMDNPLASAELANQEPIITTVSNTDYNWPNNEEIPKYTRFTEQDTSTTNLINPLLVNDEAIDSEIEPKNESKDVNKYTTERYSLKDILHTNHYNDRNVSYRKDDKLISYINNGKTNEAMKSASSNFPSMEINSQFSAFSQNTKNNEKNLYSEDGVPNLMQPTESTFLTDSDPIESNQFQPEKIPEYNFVDGQYVRENIPISRPQSQQPININLMPKIGQHDFVDGQFTPETVTKQNNFPSILENQTPTRPNVQKKINNFDKPKHNVFRPIYVICNHPIFTIFIQNILPHHLANHFPYSRENLETSIRVWLPQWRQ